MARSPRAPVAMVEMIAMFAGVVALALGAGALEAGAQTTTPGLLTTADLPSGYSQPNEARTFTTFSLPTTNPSTCTETPTPLVGITSAVLVTFAAPGAAPGVPGLSESVLTFPNATAARAAFGARVKNDKARWKCGAVGFVPVSQPTPIATINYRRATVSRVGTKAFATSGSTSTTTTDAPVTVTFVAGPYLVLVGFPARSLAPNPADEKTVLKAAQRRLSG